MITIYVDLDGVLTDFDTGFNDQYPYKLDSLSKPDLRVLKKKFAENEFFLKLPPFDGAKQFVKNIEKLGHMVVILTAVSEFDSKENARQKAKWVKKYIGNYPFEWVRKAKDKAKYADGNKNILIDDRKKSTIPYEQAGGVTILHKDFNTSITKLKRKVSLLDDKMKTYKELVSEGKKDYKIYHRLFADAIAQVMEFVEKNGFEFADDEIWNKVSVGNKKPSVGKTNKYNLHLTKNGKKVNKMVAFQVYGNKSSYELDMYIT